MNNVFNAQILAEKLSKLNNSQQSIETLSHWCIFHRKKAKQVVETWDKLFNSSQKEQRVAFLYLANDILQNSRRKGSEFVNEFWKVLPAVLKDVYENGDDHGKKAVSRLVDIWEERKVFGSRGRSLKDEMLGKDPPPLLESNGKSSNSIKIVKKDAHSIRLKLAVGGMAEKIVTAFQAVHEEHFNEDTALNKCKAAVRCVEKMEEDVDNACTQGNQQDPTLANELQEQDNILRQCIKQLESVKATRAALVSQLKEALHDQESKLELIYTQLQVAHSQIDQASNMRQRLTSATVSGPGQTTSTVLLAETTNVVEPNPLPIRPTSGITQPPLIQPVTSFAASKSTTEEDNKKAAAAAVAAKLAASTSSAHLLTSVLSSLVAEEAASMNGGTKSGRFGSSIPFSMEKRPKLEKPMPVSEMGSTAYFANVQQQSLTNSPLAPGQASTTSMQPMSQATQVQPPFQPPPPPLPPPPTHLYAQSTGMMAGVMPYGYGTSSLPPPPPLPTHVAMGLARPGTQQQQPPQQPQQPVTGSYYRPSGIGFYGQNHQPATPPVPRQ
ncbi:regulation of nuclear pre-mRNA domain-containing protein 1B-like [Telopea speciosissima]|uniref:regulation of nuclear pre-mRNA domain-containing protein 1B-like n=1 Tax=Telopea speciosissima TaxID=54955 RepID=UPI001CC71D40|nr:regulation of nuclear pre-mRNA domain-containing protein 1B-like [Telopea speciosissima]